jgi:hypothetical protein
VQQISFQVHHLRRTRHAQRPQSTVQSTSSNKPPATSDAELISQLTSENALLKSRLKLLRSQNDELLKQQRKVSLQQQQKHVEKPVREQRLILEDFEGEGRPAFGECQCSLLNILFFWFSRRVRNIAVLLKYLMLCYRNPAIGPLSILNRSKLCSLFSSS